MTPTVAASFNSIAPDDTIRVLASRFQDGVPPPPGSTVLCDDGEGTTASAVVGATEGEDGEVVNLHLDMTSFVSDPGLADPGQR